MPLALGMLHVSLTLAAVVRTSSGVSPYYHRPTWLIIWLLAQVRGAIINVLLEISEEWETGKIYINTEGMPA